MRFVLLTATFLTVASLLFNGFANSRNSGHDQLLQIERLDPVVAVSRVEIIVDDAARLHRTDLEKQDR